MQSPEHTQEPTDRRPPVFGNWRKWYAFVAAMLGGYILAFLLIERLSRSIG